MVRDTAGISKKLCKGQALITLFIIFLLTLISVSPKVSAHAYSKTGTIVIEASSGRVLSGENINVSMPMASTTKIVTALIVLENMNIDEVITVPDKSIGVEGSSIYLKKGEKWKIIDLLYGMMLRSGNDAACALAIACGGSIEFFADMMNAKADSLGLNDSHFTNPHGLHSDEHYTSPYDLAMLTREAMKYEVFREIVSAKSYRFVKCNNEPYVFLNKNKMLNFFNGANGVKTGYTKKAGRCLVSSALRDGMELITVVLNCNNMWADSCSMMNKAYSEYRMHEVLRKGEMVGETRVTNSSKKSAMLYVDDDYLFPLSNDEITKLRYESNYKVLRAPVPSYENAGSINIYLDKHLIFSANVYTIESIRGRGIIDRLKEIF